MSNDRKNAPKGAWAADAPSSLLSTAQIRWTHSAPVQQLSQDLGPTPLSLVALFVTPMADFADIVAEAQRCFPDSDVVACTTAGEIGDSGYEEGLIVAIGFPQDSFATKPLLVEDIQTFNAQPINCLLYTSPSPRDRG